MTVPHWSRCLLVLVALMAAPQATCASCVSNDTWSLELVSSTTCAEDTAQPCENPLGLSGQVRVSDYGFDFDFFEEDGSGVSFRVDPE